MLAMRSAMKRLVLCTVSVTSTAEPPVERFAVSSSAKTSPVGQHRLERVAVPLEQVRRHLRGGQPGHDLLVPVPAPRVAVLDGDELGDGVLTVAGHGGRLAPGRRHEPPVHDEHAVVVARVALLDDDLVADLLGARERLAQVGLVGDVGGDALAVVAVVRLDHDRVAEPLGVLDRRLELADDRPLGHGDAGVLQHVLGEPLVAGRLHADHARPRGDGGLDAALVLALAELHEVVVVQAEDGDAAALRLLDDGRRRRAEVVVGADVLELADDVLEVELVGAALEERVDDVDRRARRPRCRPPRPSS